MGYAHTKAWLAKHPGYKRRWYARNKRRATATRKAWLARKPGYGAEMCRKFYAIRRDAFNKLKDKPCVDCGKRLPPCMMEFDHVKRGKIDGVGNLFQSTKKKLLAEIAKCELVCVLCHRKRTCKRRGHAH